MAHTDPTPHALQTPPWLYARGAIRPWGDAVLHVNTEAVRTGFHIFEGLKAFWQADGRASASSTSATTTTGCTARRGSCACRS